MKTKNITNLFFALGIFALASCADNDVYNPDNAQKTENLKVPANFSWTTTHTTTCSITSPVNTQVSIYSDKECKDNQLLMEISLLKDQPREVTLELPAACAAFYVQYHTDKGEKAIEVKVSGATTKAADSSLVLPEDIIPIGHPDYKGDPIDHYYIPSKGTYGTVMFEDNFPDKGDYDFNDFVVGYYIICDLTRGNEGLTTDKITINLQIRAIGGSYPYRFGFELTSLLTKYVRNNCNITSNTDGITMKLISKNDNDPAVFMIEGTNMLKDGSFYNTQKLSETEMPVITCTIERNNKDDLTAYNQFTAIAMNSNYTNFFIKHASSGEEIHLKGYSVTKDATNTDTKFYTEDNFVWGMKIPVLIPNAIERIDFTEAYPHFASWVTSGGNSNKDWYKTYVADKVINPVN